MYSIRPSVNLLKKLIFIQKYSNKIQITPTNISSEFIHIQLPKFCDFHIGIDTADFIELVKHATLVSIDRDKLLCEYKISVSNSDLIVKRRINLYDLDYTINVPEPLLSIKFEKFTCLSEDDTFLTVSGSLMILETKGFVKTRLCIPIQRVEGDINFACCVKAKDLKMLNELERDMVLCFFNDCIVAYEFDEEITTAVIIRILNTK